MSTPTGPKTPGAPAPEATSRASLEQTFLGVSPAVRPPLDAPSPPPVAPPPVAPPAHPIASSAPAHAPSRIVAAPVIAVSSKTGSAPSTPRVAAEPASPVERPMPTPRVEAQPNPVSEQTLVQPTPVAVAGTLRTAPTAPALRNPFPKPEAYAVPPRASDTSRALGGADRTALSSDYLRAARDAALGRSHDVRASEQLHRAPTPNVLPNRRAFAPASNPVPAANEPRDEAPRSFSTQQSLGSEPPPRAAAESPAMGGHRAPAFGTVLEAPRGLPPPPALPALPAIPPSERGAAPASRFEPVPAARTHLSDRGATAVSGHSLGHISVDWSPELADRARSAVAAPKSGATRVALLVLAALVLVVLGFVTLGGPLRRVVARVARQAIATEPDNTPAASPTPAQTTLSNRPSPDEAPGSDPVVAPISPAEPAKP